MGQLRPAGVDGLSLFENASTELGGGAALLEFLQTLLRILSKQETLQRVKETPLHELFFLLRAGLGLQTEDPRHLLLQVAEQLCPGVCSLEPFLQERTITRCTITCIRFCLVAHVAQFNRKEKLRNLSSWSSSPPLNYHTITYSSYSTPTNNVFMSEQA